MNPDILLKPDDICLGDPEKGNAIYKDHFLATLPDGTKWIGQRRKRGYPYNLLYEGYPHECRLFNDTCIEWFKRGYETFREKYRIRFATLFGDFYRSGVVPDYKRYGGLLSYEFEEPAKIQDFIKWCHDRDVQVICYARAPARPEWRGQSWQLTLTVMQLFIYRNELDGAYCDSCYCGDLYASVRFARGLRVAADHSARRNGFEKGILFLHGSSSAWDSHLKRPGDSYGERQGLPPIPLLEEFDYLGAGESMWIAPTDPNHFIIKNFHDDSNWGRCLWYKIYRKSGSSVYPADVMTEAQIMRMNAELGGVQPLKRSNQTLWVHAYFPVYKEMQRKYFAGELEDQ